MSTEDPNQRSSRNHTQLRTTWLLFVNLYSSSGSWIFPASLSWIHFYDHAHALLGTSPGSITSGDILHRRSSLKHVSTIDMLSWLSLEHNTLRHFSAVAIGVLAFAFNTGIPQEIQVRCSCSFSFYFKFSNQIINELNSIITISVFTKSLKSNTLNLIQYEQSRIASLARETEIQSSGGSDCWYLFLIAGNTLCAVKVSINSYMLFCLRRSLVSHDGAAILI